MKASINVVCYKWKVLTNGENPLMLQVSKNGKQQYKSLGVSFHPKEIIPKIINDKLAEIQNRVLELNV